LAGTSATYVRRIRNGAGASRRTSHRRNFRSGRAWLIIDRCARRPTRRPGVPRI
jgi:hypothetical protein